MEDAHLAKHNFREDIGVFGVFDGHGGAAVSNWVAEHFIEVLEAEIAKSEERVKEKPEGSLEHEKEVEVIVDGLVHTFLGCDDLMRQKEHREKIKGIHEKMKPSNDDDEEDEEGGGGNPLEDFLKKLTNTGGGKGKQPILRMVEENGNRYLHVFHNDEEEEEDSDPEGGEAGESKVTELKEDETGDAAMTDSSSPSAAAAPASADAATLASEPSAAGEASKPLSSIADAPLPPSEPPSHHENQSDDLDNEPDPFNQTTNLKSALRSPQPTKREPKEVDGDEQMGTGEEGAEGGEGLGGEKDGEDDEDDNTSAPDTPEGCGATAVVAVVLGGKHRRLIVANAGDSRCVLSRGGKAIAMSEDHKPDNESESARIHAAGGAVVNGRVDGNLNLSRSLGDLFYKQNAELPPGQQRITAMPEVRVMALVPADEFAILACDGIWDVLSCQDAVDIVHEKLKEKAAEKTADDVKLSEICEEICDQCLAKNATEAEGIGCDNMTIMIVRFSNLAKGIEGGVGSA
uniref:PPM-type phosphatase domain-containing protein n=1 Tax=Chromera velia CCMP2878 TaxID=1169474 RepID=A0A0G4I595_9ALVE|eukprot:Cvel_11128.t1-p1 / transcript=Cvel_11128.t1 / gene=Cvel_11128 / organism=Chromera_velia_CCMP2878 / gene_product=Probable protein phosphatase 2C 60, putative / transcript_product=Probable protein phosphatase 2C 60, putative / location=Cvel_scaffold689:49069-51882(+) / protein_length=515 / sequence_SO=supercontig / SO=protein_coding / is_pseudo=false